MFGNLIESGSHKKDLKRKSTFFLGTLAFYVVLLMVAGVGSIYAYNARLEEQQFDVVMIMRFPPSQPQTAPETREAPRAVARSSAAPQIASRPEVSVITPYRDDRIASRETREVRAGTPVAISNLTSDPVENAGPIGPTSLGGSPDGTRNSNSPGGVIVRDPEDAPEPPRITPKATPAPPVERRPISLGVINGRAIDKPTPAYPAIARAARAQGIVTVQILVDERGKVVSAQATGGHPLLRQAAVEAAYRVRFTPTLLTNQPVKVSGFITYNFVLQ
ncbi:MAG TPA: TonB family protein [Pyrinomonadaceae bacterium]|jgi:protein TonB